MFPNIHYCRYKSDIYGYGTEESRLYLERTNVIFDNFSTLCSLRRRRMMLRNPLGWVLQLFTCSIAVTEGEDTLHYTRLHNTQLQLHL